MELYTIMLINVGKAPDKIHYLFMIKTVGQLRIEANSLI